MLRLVWGLLFVGFLGLGVYIGTAYDHYKAAHTPFEIDGLDIELGFEFAPDSTAVSSQTGGIIR
ncbi:MAG TPA: hypothetical protein PKD54_12625 [Pirellulaceae bacterium]|nr:hypothetical protein [Pirellulaceae bacterium]